MAFVCVAFMGGGEALMPFSCEPKARRLDMTSPKQRLGNGKGRPLRQSKVGVES